MSSSDSGNDAILANANQETETVLMVDNGDASSGSGVLHIHVHSPSTTGSGDMENQMLQYNRPKTFRKLSNSSSIISEIFRHPDTCEERLRVKIKKANDRDNSKELIDFLRNTSPPPQNHMPLFGNLQKVSSEKKKHKSPFWAICKKLKGRKGKNKQAKAQPVSPKPSLLRLPDSAVAGRTTDGHRHIAISIPVEHANLEHVSDSSDAARTLASPLIGADHVPARVSSAPRPTAQQKPTKETRAPRKNRYNERLTTDSPTDEPFTLDAASNDFPTLSPGGPARSEHARPQTAVPLSGRQSSTAGFSSAKDTTDTGMHYPAHKQSFGYSEIGIHESPDGVSVRRHQHWSWPSDSKPGFRHTSADSIVMSGTDAMVANAMALRGYSHSIANLSSNFPASGTERSPASDLRRGQSMLTFPNMGLALTSDLSAQKSMAQMSYHELINHGPDSGGSGDGDVPTTQTLRSLTFDLPPAYHYPRGGKPTSTSLQEPRMEGYLRPTPVMTVVDVKPTSSMESLRYKMSSSSQPCQPTRVFRVPDSSSPSSNLPDSSPLSSPPENTPTPPPTRVFRVPDSSPVSSSFSDGELTPRASEKQPLHHPSIEQLLYTRNPHLVDIVSPSSNIPFASSSPFQSLPSSPSPMPTYLPSYKPTRLPPVQPQAATKENRRPVPRSDSHQALAQRYEELRKSRDKEMSILLERLERLENKNDWWLNSVVPMVESMTRRLTRVYDDDSLPRLTRSRENSHSRGRRYSRSRSNSYSASTTHTTPPSSSKRAPAPTPSRMGQGQGLGHNYDNEYDTLSSSVDHLPPLSRFPSHEQSARCPRQRGGGVLEPESSYESLDSFHINHGVRVAAPPEREPSPYPYPYIYPGESMEDLYINDGWRGGRTRDNDDNNINKETRRGRDIYGAGIRQCSFGSGCSGGSIPVDLDTEMDIDTSFSSWDSSSAARRHDSIAVGMGHGTGVAVDRLPSRHGERGMLNMPTTNTTTPVGQPPARPQSYLLPRREDQGQNVLTPSTGGKSRPTSWPMHHQPRQQQHQRGGYDHINSDYGSPSPRRASGNYGGREDVSMRDYRGDEEEEGEERGQAQRERGGGRRTEWDTLEPLMRGLMKTTRLDLELGRDLDLGLAEAEAA